jgi:hypothetical protein
VMATAGLYETSGDRLYEGRPARQRRASAAASSRAPPGKAPSVPSRRHWTPPAIASGRSVPRAFRRSGSAWICLSRHRSKATNERLCLTMGRRPSRGKPPKQAGSSQNVFAPLHQHIIRIERVVPQIEAVAAQNPRSRHWRRSRAP